MGNPSFLFTPSVSSILQSERFLLLTVWGQGRSLSFSIALISYCELSSIRFFLLFNSPSVVTDCDPSGGQNDGTSNLGSCFGVICGFWPLIVKAGGARTRQASVSIPLLGPPTSRDFRILG